LVCSQLVNFYLKDKCSLCFLYNDILLYLIISEICILMCMYVGYLLCTEHCLIIYVVAWILSYACDIHAS
jgi:hypothetical protein